MTVLWMVYVAGATLSMGYFAWKIYRTLLDGSVQIDSMPPWQMLAGACVAVLGAAAIWPLSVPLIGVVAHLSQKEGLDDEE